MFKSLLAWFKRKPKECDHLYFPVVVDGKLIGQKCAFCPKFNSREDVLKRRTNQ